MTTTRPRKLIETVIPLPEINDASAYDKMPGIGPHPKGIHHWWARLPLPSARAILFASVVDDPADVENFDDLPEKEQARLLAKREALFDLIRRLIEKKPHENPGVFREAREVMKEACGDKMPEVLDPFTGGGSIPLEAQRLGFQAHGRDLNPVPALITKATIDYPARFFGRPPVCLKRRQSQTRELRLSHKFKGAQGLAEDVRFYGEWMLEKARERIGHLYPPAKVTAEMAAERPDLKPYAGKDLPVIAWIWARTVASPDPAFAGKEVPLISTYWLSSKKGKETYLEPVIESNGQWRFEVRNGKPTDPDAVRQGTKASRGANFTCLLSGTPIAPDHIKAEGKAGRMGQRLIAIVAEGKRKRLYFCAEGNKQPQIPEVTNPPTEELGYDPRAIWCPQYGLTHFADLFTARQLTALTTFSDLVEEAHQELIADGADEYYAQAIATYLAFTVSRVIDLNNSLCTWNSSDQVLRNLFKRQAIPMVWDFGEANLLNDVVGGWSTCLSFLCRSIERIPIFDPVPGIVAQQNAADTSWERHSLIISTDPPYYDNIGYADLSDFFYIWLRRSLRGIETNLTRTMLTPKVEELIAIPYRHDGSTVKAKAHFEGGFRSAFTGMKEALDPRFPLTVYYAMKQSEDTTGTGNGTTGWETLLNSLIGSGFQITATWPVRATQQWKMNALNANALASYIVLACRLREETAPRVMLRDFLAELRAELPPAIAQLQKGNIPPVDLAQAALGPGMAVYSRYQRVQEPDGSELTIRRALQLINQVVGEILVGFVGELDQDSDWAITWFNEYGFEPGPESKGEEICRAKAISVHGLESSGIIEIKRKEVRLYRRDELKSDWNPRTDSRATVWEATEHLIHRLREGGESAAAELLANLGPMADSARELAYLLYTTCERKGWNKEAAAYNSLVIAWPNLLEKTRDITPTTGPSQGEMKF